MNSKTLFLISSLLLVGCATKQPEEVPACTGHTLRGCQPVIYFKEGSSKLEWKETQNLAWALEKLQRWPDRKVAIVGHASATGTEASNLDLSKQRALNVKKYLVNGGIPEDRISVDFKGKTEPVCETADCQALNRRVEMNIVTGDSGWAREKLDKVSCFLCEDKE